MYIISDNQSLTSDALTHYLVGQPLAHAKAKEQLAELLQKHADAVVVLDFSLFDFTTPENLLIFLRRFPHARWLLLSAEFAENLVRMFSAELQVSFLTKDCTREEFLQAAYRLQQGGRTICSAVADVLSQSAGSSLSEAHLTQSETEILKLVAEGLSAKAIAERRNSSVHTIVTHKKNIFRKLGVSTAYEAARYAMRAGITDPVEYYI